MSLEGSNIGRYHLLQLLGSGGMGEVYLANDPPVNRQVAVKVIRAEVSPYPDAESTKDAARLFQREVKAIASLDHPNILPLYDYGDEVVQNVNTTYMVMPYRAEGTLTTWLQKRGSQGLLSPVDVAHIITQVASGLQYAHDHSVIHQDIKPSNFLIRANDENPQWPYLQLSDFGVAKINSATTNVSQSIRGTPTYMAPEQWVGSAVPATDQYALAVMAYELLTGRPPFQGGLGQMMYQHIHGKPQPPSTYNSSIPPELDTVILHALEKEPGQRYPSIAVFARAFQQAIQQMDGTTLLGTVGNTQLASSSPSPSNPSISSTNPKANDVYATLAISEEEARHGTQRTLTLADGKRISVSIPAGTHEGQIFQLDDTGRPVQDQATQQTVSIVLTISVQATNNQLAGGGVNSYDQTIASTPQHPAQYQYTPVPPPMHSRGNSDQQLPTYTQPANLTPPPPPPPSYLAAYNQVLVPATTSSSSRRFPLAITIAMIVLALLIVASGSIYFANAFIGRNNDKTNTPILLSPSVATATPAPGNTATSVATTAPTATPTLVPTATPTIGSSNPYTQGGTLVLNDPLVNNSQGYAWREGTNSLGASCAFSNGGYYGTQPNAGYFHSCMAQATDYANFVYEVQITLISGDYEGIVFRVNPSDTNQYYYFSIDQNGNYILKLSMDSGATTISSGSSSAINIGSGQTSTIAVVANYGNIKLYVNHQQVVSANDGTLSHGQIGFFVGNQTTNAKAMFSNAKVWRL